MSVSSPTNDEVTAEIAADGLDPLIGVTLDGRYRIVGGIGKGAMGKVYRAVQVGLNRAVALKVLDSNYGAGRDESFRQRFLVEAALTAKLSHPNTVRIYDYGCSSDGIFYLAMEFLEGETLDRILSKGPLGWRKALSVGQQIARALREAHELGVVHRDLKPANVMVLSADDDTDHVKVLDFGLVKSFVEGQELEGRAITQQGMLMGSPPYMAPEQGDKNRADPRSDIYSLGCILFECLTGKPPYSGGAPLEIILKHVNEPVPQVKTPARFETIPEGMAAIVTRCLQKSPMDRFQSMDEVLQAMSELLAPVATPAFETPLPPTPIVVNERAPSNRTPLLIAGFVFALLVGVGGTALVLRKPKVAEASRVLFHVETDPPGAQVIIGKVIKGTTPLDIELTAVDGRARADVTLSKDGYLPMTVTAAGSGPRLEIIQKLQTKPPEKPPEKAPEKQPVKVDKPPEKVPEKPIEKAIEKPNPIDKAFQGAEATPPRPVQKDPKPEALPVVTPVKSPPKAVQPKAPAKVTAPPKKSPPKSPAKLDDDDPLAPHTPPPANDLKRPK